MTSDLHIIVLLSCSLYRWLSYHHSVLRLAQKDTETNITSLSFQKKEALLQCSKRRMALEERSKHTHTGSWRWNVMLNHLKCTSSFSKTLARASKQTSIRAASDFLSDRSENEAVRDWFYCSLATNRLFSWWYVFAHKR